MNRNLFEQMPLGCPQGPTREWPPEANMASPQSEADRLPLNCQSFWKEGESWWQSLCPWPGALKCWTLNAVCLMDGGGYSLRLQVPSCQGQGESEKPPGQRFLIKRQTHRQRSTGLLPSQTPPGLPGQTDGPFLWAL